MNEIEVKKKLFTSHYLYIVDTRYDRYASLDTSGVCKIQLIREEVIQYRMSYAVDAIEYRMSVSLKQTLKTLQKNDSGIDEILQNHFLKGTFLKLSNPKFFREILFPGLTVETMHGIPKSLKEIIIWDQIKLDEKKIIKSAKEVLQNIKTKGQKEGKAMDEQTEFVLLPQIVQEALANHIVDLVRGLNRKVSNAVAQLSQRVASADSPDAGRDQLETPNITLLSKHRYCIQSEYLGSDWSRVLSKDCVRFCQYEKMTKLDEYGNMIIAEIDEDRVVTDLSKSYSEICWIELDEYMQRYYPAISIALDQLYALPHELNAKYIWDGPPFLEVNRGCTMLVRYPPGASQAIRLDCKANNLKLDSGIRMTAIYHIRRRHDNELNDLPASPSSTTVMKFTVASSGKSASSSSKDGKTITARLEDDVLTLHHSTEVKNERLSSEEEWFALVCFIHGKLS